MSRHNTRIGEVFCVKIDDNTKKYFQLIAFDLTQLNSDVVRVFKEQYPLHSPVDLSSVIGGEVDFYAHCITKIGVKFGYWQSVGIVKNVGSLNNNLFRSIGDVGKQVEVSSNWWIWRMNEPQVHVGKLTGDLRRAEIGSIVPPDSLTHRIRTGYYDFKYPAYE
jgi:hypothetical protein